MPTHSLRSNGPKKAKTCVVLAHGAGESSDSGFLTWFAEQLGELGHRVIRFDFPYMAQRSTTGRKRPPDREDVLLQTWREVVEGLPFEREKIVIGGKSMGGRMASMVADELQVAGVVALGYPFHPTGRSEKTRIEHLQSLTTPMLVVQGTNDPFGTREEVESYGLSQAVEVHWVPDGDHSYRPGRGSERAHDQNLKNALRAIERFLVERWIGG